MKRVAGPLAHTLHASHSRFLDRARNHMLFSKAPVEMSGSSPLHSQSTVQPTVVEVIVDSEPEREERRRRAKEQKKQGKTQRHYSLREVIELTDSDDASPVLISSNPVPIAPSVINISGMFLIQQSTFVYL